MTVTVAFSAHTEREIGGPVRAGQFDLPRTLDRSANRLQMDEHRLEEMMDQPVGRVRLIATFRRPPGRRNAGPD